MGFPTNCWARFPRAVCRGDASLATQSSRQGASRSVAAAPCAFSIRDNFGPIAPVKLSFCPILRVYGAEVPNNPYGVSGFSDTSRLYFPPA